MTPLQICREAKGLSLSQLATKLNRIKGSSKASLHRLETTTVSSINKQLLNSLIDIFEQQGLTIEHLMSPESFPDFKVNYTQDETKNLDLALDTKILTEKEIIITATQKWFDSSNMVSSKFSELLYTELSAAGLVPLEPSEVDDYEKWVSSSARRVSRIMDGSSAFPLEWKYYWLSCFPEDLKISALTQIMSNTGYLLVPLPTNSALNIVDSRAKLDEISKQFAGVIGNSKPAMDGFYDNRDSKEELQLMQDNLAQLLASVLREMTLIENNTGIQSKLSQIWHNSPLNGTK